MQTDFSQLKTIRVSSETQDTTKRGKQGDLREYSEVREEVIDYFVNVLHVMGKHCEAQFAVQFGELPPVHQARTKTK